MVSQSEMWWSGAVVGDCGYVRANHRDMLDTQDQHTVIGTGCQVIREAHS